MNSPPFAGFAHRWSVILTTLMFFDIQLVDGPTVDEEFWEDGVHFVHSYKVYYIKYRNYLYNSAPVKVDRALSVYLSTLAAQNDLVHVLLCSRFHHLKHWLGEKHVFSSFLDPYQRKVATYKAETLILSATDE